MSNRNIWHRGLERSIPGNLILQLYAIQALCAGHLIGRTLHLLNREKCWLQPECHLLDNAFQHLQV